MIPWKCSWSQELEWFLCLIHLTNFYQHMLFYFIKKNFFSNSHLRTCLKREVGSGGGVERNINVRTIDWLPSIPASTGIGLATQLCALPGNGNLLSLRMTLNSLSHSGQARHTTVSTAPLRLLTFRPDIVLEMGNKSPAVIR